MRHEGYLDLNAWVPGRTVTVSGPLRAPDAATGEWTVEADAVHLWPRSRPWLSLPFGLRFNFLLSN